MTMDWSSITDLHVSTRKRRSCCGFFVDSAVFLFGNELDTAVMVIGDRLQLRYWPIFWWGWCFGSCGRHYLDHSKILSIRFWSDCNFSHIGCFFLCFFCRHTVWIFHATPSVFWVPLPFVGCKIRSGGFHCFNPTCGFSRLRARSHRGSSRLSRPSAWSARTLWSRSRNYRARILTSCSRNHSLVLLIHFWMVRPVHQRRRFMLRIRNRLRDWTDINVDT